jgi:hypothetical protein
MRKRNHRIGRNDPCPCGSGKKYKYCHGVLLNAARGMPDGMAAPSRSAITQHFRSNIAVVWVAHDVFGRSLNWEQSKALLCAINRESALLSMAMINAVCAELSLGENLGNVEGATKVTALAHYLFPDEVRARAVHVYLEEANQAFIAIAPQACIAMTEACIRYCSRNGGERFEQPHQNPHFSHVLLSFQENLMRGDLTARGLDKENLTAEQFRFFAKNYLAANFERDFRGLLRRHYMMFEITEDRGAAQERIRKDARSWFKEVTGVDPELYRVLLMFVMQHGRRFNIEAPNLHDLVYNIDAMLQNVAPEPASAYRHLHNLAILEEQLPANDPSDWESAVYGFHYLRLRPVLHLGGAQFICLHKHLLYEKFLSGTVHVLTELVHSHPPPGWPGETKERVDKVRSELGYIFEDYVRKLLDLLFTGPDVIRRYGLHHKGGGEYDALVIVGSVALAFEIVHHPWSLAERASGESGDFIRHLADNIKKAGALCTQITREGRVADREVSIEMALPVVVMSEMLPINDMTALTLQHDLVAATSRDLVLGYDTVQAVQTLSIAQLENLDRLNVPEGASSLAAFLGKRSRDPLARLSGEASLHQRLGRSRRLQQFEDAAYQSFRDFVGTVF